MRRVRVYLVVVLMLTIVVELLEPPVLTIYYTHIPQSVVLGHCLGLGLVSGSQLVVLHVTVPGVPDAPAATPHLLAHPDGSPRTQSPGISQEEGEKRQTKNNMKLKDRKQFRQ